MPEWLARRASITRRVIVRAGKGAPRGGKVRSDDVPAPLAGKGERGTRGDDSIGHGARGPPCIIAGFLAWLARASRGVCDRRAGACFPRVCREVGDSGPARTVTTTNFVTLSGNH